MCLDCERGATAVKAIVGGVAVLLVCLTLGCKSDGLVIAAGRVTFDGQPLADGSISFCPFDKTVAPQGGRIQGGRFQLRCHPGKHRVEILASRPKAGAVEITPGMTPQEQYIPARYNDASSLEAEVTPQGPNEFTFELESNRR